MRLLEPPIEAGTGGQLGESCRASIGDNGSTIVEKGAPAHASLRREAVALHGSPAEQKLGHSALPSQWLGSDLVRPPAAVDDAHHRQKTRNPPVGGPTRPTSFQMGNREFDSKKAGYVTSVADAPFT
nr:hypothetical protein [Methylobacterium indicum]